MRDLLPLLADAGAWALPHFWLPVAVWTLAALAAEVALRLRPSTHPLLALGVRRAMLWALPMGLLAALVLPGLLPAEAAERMAFLTPPALALPTATVGATPEATVPSATAPRPLAPLVAGLAFVIAALFAAVRLGALARGLWWLGRLTSGTMADPEVQRRTDHLARLAGVGRPVRTVTTERPTVPYTFGWRRPVIVLPADLAHEPEQLRLVLAHEIAHVAQGDFASGVAERAVSALFGWHPLVGALARGIDLDRERATDAAVLADHPEDRRTYADLLLSFSRLPSPALALGAARGSHSLTSRITTMQAPPLSPVRLRRLGRAAHLLALALFLGAVSLAATVAVGPAQARTLIEASGEARVPVTEASAPLRPTANEASEADHPQPENVAPEALEIRGRISDVTTNQPIAGASVSVIGTTIGAATDAEGRFVLLGADPDGVQLRITAPGYATITFVPQTIQPLQIGLVPLSPEERLRMLREIAEQSRPTVDSLRAIDPNGPQAPDIFEVVESPPRIIGGMQSLQSAVVYPPEAKAAGVEGKVFVQFVVNETGGVQDARTIRCPDERLCDAALAAVRAAQFEPGRQRGQAVKVRFTLPVDFKLAASGE